MKLENLKIACIGDSLTEGIGSSCVSKNYPSLLKEKCNLKEIINLGKSGTRISVQRETYMHYKEWDENFLTRVNQIPEDTDIILVWGGTNDYDHGDALLGCFGDDSEYTFYGALNILMKNLLEKFPDKTIVFITPIHRVDGYNPDNATIRKGHSLKAYSDAIKETAEYYSIPVCDLFSMSGMNPNIKEQKDLFYADDVHLNDKGYNRIAERIKSFLENL